MRIAFDVTGTPAPKGSARAMLIQGKARLVPGSSNTNTVNVRAWEAAVREAATGALAESLRGSPPSYIRDRAVRVLIDFRLAKPRTAKRALPTVKPDLDKLARATLDGMTGIVFDDDARVTTLLVTKRYDANPGARILVEAA